MKFCATTIYSLLFTTALALNKIQNDGQQDSKTKVKTQAAENIGNSIKSVGNKGMDESAEATLISNIGWLVVAFAKGVVAKNDGDYTCWKEVVLDSDVTEEEVELFQTGMPLSWLRDHSNYDLVFNGPEADVVGCRRVSDGALFEIRETNIQEGDKRYLHVSAPRRRITQ